MLWQRTAAVSSCALRTPDGPRAYPGPEGPGSQRKVRDQYNPLYSFPKVVEQLAQYTSWLRHADHRDLVAHAYHSEALEWCRAAGAEIAYIHTSGHASPTDLRAFAASLRPKFVVPIHGVKWDEESRGFGAVRRLADAETLTIP